MLVQHTQNIQRRIEHGPLLYIIIINLYKDLGTLVLWLPHHGVWTQSFQGCRRRALLSTLMTNSLRHHVC
jgi:hypothetical protein